MTRKEIRRKQFQASWARTDVLNRELKDPLSIGRLCQLADVTPQLVNKYQCLGLVRSPYDRRRGRRQAYNSWDLMHVVSSKFLSHFFQLKDVVGIRLLEAELSRRAARSSQPRGRSGTYEVRFFFYPQIVRFREPDLAHSNPRMEDLLARYLRWRVKLRNLVSPMNLSDCMERAAAPFSTWL